MQQNDFVLGNKRADEPCGAQEKRQKKMEEERRGERMWVKQEWTVG